MAMQTVQQRSQSKVIVQKSSFFGHVEPLETEDEVKERVAHIAKQHKKANHVAYAYRIATTNKLGEVQHITRACDDGEPHKTAGLPLLKLLEQQELSNTIVLVARIFGGVKLGPAGLSKAYRLAAKVAIEENEKKPLAHADNPDRQ
jgi:putative IMPACT (imprinted ancient) family translation regulator